MSPTGVPRVVLAVRRFLDGPDGPGRGSHGLLAVSGGADSTAMALVLATLAPARGLRLTIGHVDHGLRPTSAAERRCVEELGRELGLPVEATRVHVDAGRAVEATARRLRYRALAAMARTVGATWIATAHTRNDQAETVLFRLVRGGGRRGIGGMRPRRGMLLRPLLEVSRADVRWYLGDRGVRPVEDPSNADLRFARNRIRHLVLPILEEEMHADVVCRLAGLAGRLRDEDDVLASLADERARARDVTETLPVGVAEEPAALARRIARAWLLDRGAPRVGSRHVEAILALARRHGGGEVAMPGGAVVTRQAGRLHWLAVPPETIAPFHAPVEPGTVVHGPTGAPWRLSVSPCEPRGDLALPPDPTRAIFDAERLPGPLAVRSVRPGDRMRLPRLGTRKVQDVFVDRRVPRTRRAAVPILTAGDEILWVAGVARSEVARVDAETTLVLTATLHEFEVGGLPAKNRCGSLPTG